jgi:DNA invertase Pin-like site-specific DNA recombinase
VENTAKQVIIINPTKKDEKKIRVAAYCRVSTDSQDQVNSFFAQVRYYTDYIRHNDKMTLVDIYADEGITGTEVDKRDEFKRMMKDAKNRKIDRVVVKSFTRFARNSLECLESIRALKSYGASVYFENDHIDTSIHNSEMIIYIKSAFAQNEAMSASRRMALSTRMRMEDGTFVTPNVPYGYRLENGELVIVEEEAARIRKVFELYLSGMGANNIVKEMRRTEQGNMRWTMSGIKYMLNNERYVGDMLMQKFYTPQILPLRSRPNKGALPMYYAKDTHEPIITREMFDSVKKVKAERDERYTTVHSGKKEFLQGKLKCRCCNRNYRKRFLQTQEMVWLCNNKGTVDGVNKCNSIIYTDFEIKSAFVQMYNTLKQNEKVIIDETIAQLNTLKVKVNAGNDEIAVIDNEIASLADQNKVYAELYASGIIDEVTYLGKTDKYKNRMTELRCRRLKLINEDEEELCIENLRELKRFLANSMDFMTEMDEGVFSRIVKTVYAEDDGALTFRLKCDLELKIYVRR